MKPAPDQNQTTAREAFEQWAKGRGMYTALRHGRFVDNYAAECWRLWQAAWTAAKENSTP